MKVKFTKLAALLLAGAALLASGCTDYEVDIQKANQRIDQLNTELSNQVDALKSLLQTTYETIANHDADVAKINKSITDLETALKEDYQKKIQDAVNTLTTEINKKVNQADYDVDKAAFQKAINDLNVALEAAKDRIKAIEDADFQKQINDLNAALSGRLDKVEALLAGDWDGKTVKQAIDAVAQSVVDLEAALRGEIGKLEVRVKANEDAIKELNEKTIPAIKERLDDLETLTDGGEEGWVDAEGKPVNIKQYIDGNVDLIWNAVKALQALTAGFPEGQTIKQYVDAADQALDSKIVSVIAKAFGTEAQMKEMEGTLLGRLAACEELLAGDWGSETVKQYIDRKANELQAQINTLNAKVKVIDDALAFCKVENADGTYSYDLKGEFDKVNDRIDAVIEWAAELFADIYDKLYEALSRIQSIQYVPDYDDLKITTNVALYSQPGMPEGEVILIDQPTKMTYQILPAQYASAVAAEIKKNIIAYGENPWTYDQLHNSNFTDKLIAYFNVKPVNTRAEEAPETLPEFQIIGIDKVDNTTGEITFVVQPKNVASSNYLANGLKPRYDLDLYFEYTYWDCGLEVYGNQIYYFGGQYVSDGDWVVAAKWDDDLGDFVDQWPVYGQDPNNPQYRATTVPVWMYQDLMNYQARQTYAAQLVLYKKEAIVEDEESIEFTGVDYENHLASPYNVLYPATFDMTVEPDPYKKLDDGSVRKFTADEQHQKLSYNTLRSEPVIEKDAEGNETVVDPGYRTILDQAVPAVTVDGKGPMTIEAALKAGYNVPPFKTEFKEFTYDKGTAAEVKEENFIATPKVYAELEMNPERSAALRKLAIGNVITGTYAFTSSIAAFTADGDVTITKELGAIDVAAEIKWLYKYDADVDHAVFYDGAGTYSRAAVEITPDAEQYAKLGEKLGITLADFKKATPKSVKITDKAGAEVTDLVISNVTIDGEKLTADFAGYKWGEVYTIVAVYELASAEITVNGTLTTIDRNHEIIDITLPDYAIALNGADYDAANDFYTTKPEAGDFLDALYKKFIANEIINQVASAPDFANAEAFLGGQSGKEGHLERYLESDGSRPAGESPYVICGDDYAQFYQVKSEDLYKIWKKGDPQVRNVTTYIGQRVRITWKVTVALPGYDFLHLRYYTFNPEVEADGFITKLNFDANTGNAVKWWTQVNPSYFNDKLAAGQTVPQSQRVSNRFCLADYDVAYINLAELAFNVVDEKDEPISDDRLVAEKVVVDFEYTTIDPQAKLPTVDQITGSFEKYVNLWVTEHPTTVFYYRTNDKPFIQATGKLGIKSGNTVFELPTRFDTPKEPKGEGVTYTEKLDYSTFAIVRWTPFQEPVANGYTMVLDENKIYRVPLFKGMNLKDNRPNNTEYDVIVDGEWVKGNVANPDAKKEDGGNGYLKDVMAWDAYHIKPYFTYDNHNLPVDLRKLLTFVYTKDNGATFMKESEVIAEVYPNGVPEGEKPVIPAEYIPYVQYDYTSEVQFHGVVTIPVVVELENPWQETLEFSYDFVIKGYGD